MSTFQIILLAAMGVAFVIWSFFMFTLLLRLSCRSVAKNAEAGGGYASWVGESLRSFTGAATSSEDRPLRKRILRSTLVMVALIALNPVIANLGHSPERDTHARP